MCSAATDRFPENICVAPVVVPELELFAADFVIAAHDPALNQKPEAFNRVRVDRTHTVMAGLMLNRMVPIFRRQVGPGTRD